MIRSTVAITAATAGVVAFLAASAPANATLIVANTFVYNFNSLSAGNLVGQDNWTGTNGNTQVGAAEAGYPTSGQRILGNGSSAGTIRRTNNIGFSFLIPDDTPRFDLSFLSTHGNSSTGTNTQALFGLSTSGTTEISFGLRSTPNVGVLNRSVWGVFNGTALVNDQQDQDNGGWFGGGNSIWRYRLQVDQFGFAGAGTAKASFYRTTISPNTFAPVGVEVAEPDLQNITITGLPTLSSMNQLLVQISNFTRMDDLSITTYVLVPEPSSAALWAVGLLALGLFGWRYRSAGRIA